MENDGRTEDEQDSVWLEVRKKHRISSKFSNQKASVVSSIKSSSNTSHYRAPRNGKVRNLHSQQQTESSKAQTELSSEDINSVYNTLKSSSVNNSSILQEPGQSIVYLDKTICNELIGEPVEIKELDTEPNDVLNKKFYDLPKIKWGDIEDGYFSAKDSSRTKEVSAQFANCSRQKHANLKENVDKEVLSENFEQFSDEPLSDGKPEISVAMEWTEMRNPTVTDSQEALKNPRESLDEFCGATQIKSQVHLISSDADVGDCISLGVPVKGAAEMTPEVPPHRSVCRIPSMPEASETDIITVVDTAFLDKVPQNKEINVNISANDSFPIAMEDVELDLGEERGEGKERFRERLWCFLFENLNRALDELYLLCELECDMDQMNEAILVLEEAASDFRELKCRVQDFENAKKTAAQSPNDVAPANIKADHRRPHALSWEVRRMTNSPHRAEILSSSLEVFRKIQMERASKHASHDGKELNYRNLTCQNYSRHSLRANVKRSDSRRIETSQLSTIKCQSNLGNALQDRHCAGQTNHFSQQKWLVSANVKSKKEPLETISELNKQTSKKDKLPADNGIEKQSNVSDITKRYNLVGDREKEREKRIVAPWKSMDAWKEKRNWEDILKSPLRGSSRVSISPCVGRKGVERVRVLHDKLMSPEKRKKSALDMRREAEERHARAMRIRGQLENERLQRLHRASEKLNRVNEWQAVRSLKLREGLHARHQRSESRHEAYLAQVVKRAGDESSKVNEVRFITSLNEENKKLILRQKLHDSELRRAEKMQTIRIRQKEDMAREEAAMERRKLLEAEKLQRLAETKKKKEEARLRREEERKASSAAREAKAVEQLRRKEIRAKAQQEEAELLAQKLAEKLSESEQRRKFYLEQIREKASTDFRDQSSPLLRRSLNKEGLNRHLSTNNMDENQPLCVSSGGDLASGSTNPVQQQSLKRKIKKIRQRLMALKHEFIESPFFAETSGVGYKALVGAARVKIGKWIQELQKLRQARKEGAASIGLVIGEMIKYLDGKDLELHACRQAALLDFISSSLPASHTSKPEACQVTIHLLRLLRVVLSVPANRGYFLSLNLLPPIIPMLSASLENYIKVAASSNAGGSNVLPNRLTDENMDTVMEVLDGFLFTVTAVMGYTTNEERQLQMQDGLLELIVCYQTIHRLRDLFALYDRPLVEGSPFPSSIMLSLNLLLVLTSRPGSASSIDWETCLSKSMLWNKEDDSQIWENHDTEYKLMMSDPSGDDRSPQPLRKATSPPTSDSIAINIATPIHGKSLHPSTVDVSDASENRLIDVEFRSGSSDVSVGLNSVETPTVADKLSNGTQNIKLKEHAKSANNRDENTIIDTCMDDKKGNGEKTMSNNARSKNDYTSKQTVASLLSAIADTGLVSLTSFLTAVLLQANNRPSPDQALYVLPSNFEEVATGVLRVLNNLALLDLSLLQKMLAMPDLKMEFFHLMSFLLSHCTSKWKSANDQVGLLLLEALVLLGYFALFHAGNQAVLRWGKSPTILHKVCDLPFVFFSDPELTPILASMFVAACYGCEQNRGVVQQELSMDMLLTLLRSCRYGLFSSQSDSSPPDSNLAIALSDASSAEAKRPHGDRSPNPNRKVSRNTLGKGGVLTGGRITKARFQRDNRGIKTFDEWGSKHNPPSSGASTTFMLHRRFPAYFLDKAEEFFAAGSMELEA